MQSPKGRGRITPLPPPEPDGAGRHVADPPRPWLMAVGVFAALVGFAIWLAGAGDDSPSGDAAADPSNRLSLSEPAPTTPPAPVPTPAPPTTAVPRPLGELLPWLDGSLMMFSRGSEGEFLIVWDEDVATPQQFGLSARSIDSVAPEPATLDFIAYEATGRVRSLYLGGWQSQEPIFVGSQGYAWDPNGSATLMWVGTDQVTFETSLYRLASTGSIEKVAPMPANSRLMAWTERGLIVAERRGESVNVIDDTGMIAIKRPTLTVLRDLAGQVIATAVAEPLRVAPNGTIVAVGTSDAFAASDLDAEPGAFAPPSEIVIIDVPQGDAQEFTLRMVPDRETLDDGGSVFSADNRWGLSPDGQWVGRTVSSELATTLVFRSILNNELAVIPLQSDGVTTTIGFSADSQRFFLWSPASADLTIVGIDGSQSVIPLEFNVRLGGAYIR